MREPDFVDECYADKDLSLLKKLTLVIPTYNRNYYLSRCLWYHAHFPFGEIIVADSSPEAKKVVNRETVAKVREMFGANVRYLEYEPETEKYGGDIYRKWGDALQHSSCQYSQFCTDKEYLNPDTLSTCINYLDTHPEYVVAEGGDYKITKEMNSFVLYSWQATHTIAGDTAIERLSSYISLEKGGSGTLFGTHRTNILKEIYNNLQKYGIHDLRFGETALELQSVLYGKAKRMPNLIANCRDCVNINAISQNFKSESSYYRYPSLMEYPVDYREKCFDNLKKCLINVILEQSQIQLDNSTIIDSLLKKALQLRYGAPTRLWNLYLFRNIWYKSPSSIKRLIIKYFAKEYESKKLFFIPTNINCILYIIEITKNNYDTDSVIPIVALSNIKLISVNKFR